jgi:HNH endonuclease
MSNYVSEELRRLVANRAERLCEYCLIHEDDTFFGCEIDHIVSLKHSGPTEAVNLAYACSFCNRNKGSDIASLSGAEAELVRFFNPRIDLWSEHFRLEGNLIESLTSIGEATARILKFNESERVVERETLIALGRYPSKPASVRMRD